MEYGPGQHLTVHDVAERRRPMLRAVALAYRRARRAGLAERSCFEAALDEFMRLDPSAASDRLGASHEVGVMIAAAINADIAWFWSGPDA
jgi:hypothetical protein